jgi:hypothetical protein
MIDCLIIPISRKIRSNFKQAYTMINHSFLVIILVATMSNPVFAAESNHANGDLLQPLQHLNQQNNAPISNPQTEAITTANTFSNIANSNQTHAVSNQNIYVISTIAKLKAIINKIEIETKNIVDDITRNPNSLPDAEKLNPNVDQLKSQSDSLFNLIGVPVKPAMPAVDVNETTDKTFRVFND